jgi:hypothetical protein
LRATGWVFPVIYLIPLVPNRLLAMLPQPCDFIKSIFKCHDVEGRRHGVALRLEVGTSVAQLAVGGNQGAW